MHLYSRCQTRLDPFGGGGGGVKATFGIQSAWGSGTQKFVYQKWPIFSCYEIRVQGGGPPSPPTVVSRSNTSPGGGPYKKTDKYKPEAMHSTVRHKCVCILDAKPGHTSRHTRRLKQKTEHHV